MPQLAYLVYSTIGGSVTCVAIAWALGWHRTFKSVGSLRIGPFNIPRELLWLIPSGICTAIVVPTTTLMYSFTGIDVMLAVVIMRGSLIVIGRIIDAIHLRLGISKKKVLWEENAAAVLAVIAVGVGIFVKTSKVSGEVQFFNFAGGELDFFVVPAAMITLCAYLGAYAIRLHLMNWSKSTGQAATTDPRSYLVIEQTVAFVTMGLVLLAIMLLVPEGASSQTDSMRQATNELADFNMWVYLAVLSGVPFGLSTFPSVFMFLFKGRGATFTVLANRLTSLVGGTVATLLLIPLGKGWPKAEEWTTLFLVTAASFMLWLANERAKKLKATAGL